MSDSHPQEALARHRASNKSQAEHSDLDTDYERLMEDEWTGDEPQSPPQAMRDASAVVPELHTDFLSRQGEFSGGSSSSMGSPSSSESEFSLLNPSASSTDQSRKNSLSGSLGFHHIQLTPTQTMDPSIETSSLDQSGASSSERLDSASKQRLEPRSEIKVAAEAVVEAVKPVATPRAEPAAGPGSPPARYRTTVEDTASNSDDERNHESTGLRQRVHARPSTLTRDSSSTTMPGAYSTESTSGSTSPHQEQPTAHTPVAPPPPPPHDQPVPVEERQCRICLGGADEEDTLGRLISPCLCKGSMKYVHVEWDDFDDKDLARMRKELLIFKTPDSLRAVFHIDKTHMVFGSFFVSVIGFLQLLISTVWIGGGGGGIFRIGSFGIGGGGRRRGERQREGGVGGALLVVVLIFGMFKSIYMTYQFVHRMSRKALEKAEMMVLEVQ
ncbi:hypothetical protein BGW38_009679 [Lunasporangiospora selenospora]|uniref:RING-CH-type domain-containing protein n=1 Tax=Lunasporangiospora selenospora TaxID=979761 RepID=A0A9P6KF77_9FUNG|nr:hypothetical protein BGW38_009679 [Lunasporangiospora selenospora]